MRELTAATGAAAGAMDRGAGRAPGGDPSGLDSAAAPTRKLLLLFGLLCLAGVGVAIELTRIHVLVHTDPSYHSVCSVSEGLNCEIVALSPYSVFAGIPVSMWGIAGYLGMGLLALWGASARRLHPGWPLGLLLFLAATSVVCASALAFISVTQIDSLCLFCIASYVISGALLVVAIISWRKARAGVVELVRADGKALVARPALFALLAMVGTATPGALLVAVPSYWKVPGWDDLPRLTTGTDNDGHHWVGASDPAVTITEFSDYQCPHCRAAHRNIRLLTAQHPERIRLVHRHLPLDQACHPAVRRPFHTHACLFAEAAECAGRQGRFWEMNDALFAIQGTVITSAVDPVALAARLGLNHSAFRRCLESHATADHIGADVRAAMALRLNGTPSFLVGDRPFLGGIPKEEVERLLTEPRADRIIRPQRRVLGAAGEEIHDRRK